MSRNDIDKAIYDKARYDSLRERGVSEDRAKRVATVPLDHNTAPENTRDEQGSREPLAKELAQQQRFESEADAPPSTSGFGGKVDPGL